MQKDQNEREITTQEVLQDGRGRNELSLTSQSDRGKLGSTNEGDINQYFQKVNEQNCFKVISTTVLCIITYTEIIV